VLEHAESHCFEPALGIIQYAKAHWPGDPLSKEKRYERTGNHSGAVAIGGGSPRRGFGGQYAPELQAAVLRASEAPSGGVEINLAEVSFLSSAGLRALLMGSKALQKRGERLALSSVPPQIYNILNLTGFASFIDVKA